MASDPRPEQRPEQRPQRPERPEQGPQRPEASGRGLPALDDAWLVVVDPQVIFADPGSDWGSPMFDGALGPIRDLAADFGADRTLLTRWVPGEHVGSWRAYFERWPFADRPAADAVFDPVPAVEGLSTRPTIDASTFGKWDELHHVTGLTPTLVLAGVATDCCVVSTALPAADAGATIVVAADACAGSSRANHDAALHLMGLYDPQVVVSDSAGVRTALRSGHSNIG